MSKLMIKISNFFIENRLIAYLLFIAMIIAGFISLQSVPVDAIPDIGENQVIVFADWPGRSPKDIENQVTFPLTTALQGVPGVKEIRAQSAFGFSMIYIIFNDNVDFYFARSRVLEKLSYAQTLLPQGVVPILGPDATGLGQVFWYTVESDKHNLQELRSLQDWYIKFALASVEGVSEVASIGGYVKQYQIDVDPNKVYAYNIKMSDLIKAVKEANIDVGAKLIEANGMEFMVRGVGFIKSVQDIENIVIGSFNGVPVKIKQIGNVVIGPDFRQGVLDKEGKEAVGGVVIMRYGQNPKIVIDNVKQKIADIAAGLPDGVKIVPFYDRTDLIQETQGTLTEALIIEILITIAVILAFLLPVRMSLIISLTLPVSVLFSFLMMKLFHVDAHIMSLAGIIIAIGTIVDMGIIMTENIHRNVTDSDKSPAERANPLLVVKRGAGEVAGAVLGAITTTIIPFFAILVLEGQSAKLFHPVVYTKTFVLIGSLLTALFLLPSLYVDFILPGKNGLSKFLDKIGGKKTLFKLKIAGAVIAGLVLIERLFTLIRVWNGIDWGGIGKWIAGNVWMLVFSVVFVTMIFLISHKIKEIVTAIIEWALKNKWVLAVPAAIFLFSIYLLVFRIQNEFRPPLDEGSFLFMPVLLPSSSLSQTHEVLTKQNEIIKSFPEVASVVGKLGRIESATDPAPTQMIETIINLKPKDQWRPGMTKEKLINEMNHALQIPGVGNIWTQPIQNRIDMLSTGIRTPVGIKVFGPDLEEIEKLTQEIEKIVRQVPGYSDSYAERIIGKPYIEYIINREEIAKFGLSIMDVQQVIETAIGGENLTMTVEGRERYPIRIRYMREYRDSLDALKNILFITPSGEKIPLSRIADINVVMGPGMINSENGILRGIIYLNLLPGTGPVDFVNAAKKLIDEKVQMPKGYYYEFAGDFENQITAFAKLGLVLPLCLLAIFMILYFTFNSVKQSLIVFLAIPITLSGGIILLWILGYNMSIAVAVGFVALFGIAVDDGIVLTTYINQNIKKNPPKTLDDVHALIITSIQKRARPLFMTTATTILALVPVLWATGRGSEIIRPMAVPSIGGMTIELISIIIVPLLNSFILERELKKQIKHKPQEV